MVFCRRYKTVMKVWRRAREVEASLVMAGDLARLRILTRMQGNPTVKFACKGGG
jgi:hypothetical protein